LKKLMACLACALGCGCAGGPVADCVTQAAIATAEILALPTPESDEHRCKR